MSAIDKEKFPKGALYAAAGLIAISLVAAAAGRWNTVHNPQIPVHRTQTAVSQIALKFTDGADGSVAVTEGITGRPILTIHKGEDAFIRQAMHALTRKRGMLKIGAEAPFRLARYADGRVIIEDPQTGQYLDLRAFGVSNRDAFARLLPDAAGTAVRADTAEAAPAGSADQAL